MCVKVTPELVQVMVKLAAVGQGAGHRQLFLATLDWILKYRTDILQGQSSVLRTLSTGQTFLDPFQRQLNSAQIQFHPA